MLIIILVIALILRLVNLDQSLWLDEGTTALISRDMSYFDFFVKFLPRDFHPPLYYLSVKFFTDIFGNYSEVFLRLPSVIAGIGAVFVLYKINKLSAIFLATAPLHVYYSQEARMYSLATFFVLLSFYFYLKCKSKKKFVFIAFSSLFLAFSFLTDYLTILILPVFFVDIIFTERKEAKKFMLALPIFFVLVFPIIPFLLNQLSSGLAEKGSNWWGILGVTNFKNLILVPVKFIIGRISFPQNIYALFMVLVGSVFLFLVINALKRLKKDLLIWLWLTLPVLIAAFVGFFIPVLSYFRLLFVLPAFYIIVSKGIAVLPKKQQVIGLILIMGINLFCSFTYLFNKNFHRENWRGLVKTVEERENSQVLFPANSQMEAYKYYSKNKNFSGPGGFDPSKNEIWLVRYVYDIVDPEDIVRRKVELSGLKKVAEYDFNGVVLFKYENRN